jgi:PAS domain S-box-containing protein
MNALFLNECRCKCGKLLLKGVFFDGTVEIKCKKCGTINSIGRTKLTDNEAHYLLVINSQGLIANASDSACHILGYSQNELIGMFFTKIDPTIPVELGKKMFGPELALKKDNHFRIDTVHKSKDGKSIPIIAYLKLHEMGEGEKFLLLSAELKNIAADSKIKGEDVPKFVDNNCDFYFEIDKNGMGEYMSPSTEKIFGFVPANLIGKNFLSHIPADARGLHQERFAFFSSKAQPHRIIYNNEFNGVPVNVELFFTPKLDEFGKFIGYRVLGWLVKNS